MSPEPYLRGRALVLLGMPAEAVLNSTAHSFPQALIGLDCPSVGIWLRSNDPVIEERDQVNRLNETTCR